MSLNLNNSGSGILSCFILTLLIAVFTIITFEPAHAAIADYNLAAAGDWGCNSNTDKTVDNADAKNPERVLALGDYSYSSTGNVLV